MKTFSARLSVLAQLALRLAKKREGFLCENEAFEEKSKQISNIAEIILKNPRGKSKANR